MPSWTDQYKQHLKSTARGLGIFRPNGTRSLFRPAEKSFPLTIKLPHVKLASELSTMRTVTTEGSPQDRKRRHAAISNRDDSIRNRPNLFILRWQFISNREKTAFFWTRFCPPIAGDPTRRFSSVTVSNRNSDELKMLISPTSSTKRAFLIAITSRGKRFSGLPVRIFRTRRGTAAHFICANLTRPALPSAKPLIRRSGSKCAA